MDRAAAYRQSSKVIRPFQMGESFWRKKMATKTFDLGLDSNLYVGCEIGEVGGRKTLLTKPAEAANILGRNTIKEIEATAVSERAECVLTGAMAVWAYLVVFHQVVHKFGKVFYDDGRGNRVLVAQH